MFINTMAVPGPFELVAFCVTGGATVAFLLLHAGRIEVAGEQVVTRLETCVNGARIAILKIRYGSEGLQTITDL
jgi:hypothetical protein